jgi:hypothetical protein
MVAEAINRKTVIPEMRKLLALPMMVIPKQESVRNGQLAETRRRHLYALYDILEEVAAQDTWTETHLSEVLVECVDRIQKKRGWESPATKVSFSETLYGGLQSLSLYTNLAPIVLENDIHWNDARKTWMKDVCAYAPNLPEVTAEGVEKILEHPKCEIATACLLSLVWSTTGRPYNWLYVKREDLTREPATEAEGGTNLSVTWKDHKTVKTRQAFTTHSWMNKKRSQKVETWFKMSKNSDYVIPKSMWKKTTDQLKELLKEINPDWDLKALRRGSLSTMARAGVPLDVLMNFSGHKSKATLLRYLRWGAHAKDEAKKTQAAARHLQ